VAERRKTEKSILRLRITRAKTACVPSRELRAVLLSLQDH
jgi:hypothetical protein